MNYIKSGNTTLVIDEYERFRIIKTIHGSVIGIKNTDDHFVFSTPELKRLQANKKARRANRERNEAMTSIGMTKVRGNLGGTYWE